MLKKAVGSMRAAAYEAGMKVLARTILLIYDMFTTYDESGEIVER